MEQDNWDKVKKLDPRLKSTLMAHLSLVEPNIPRAELLAKLPKDWLAYHFMSDGSRMNYVRELIRLWHLPERVRGEWLLVEGVSLEQLSMAWWADRRESPEGPTPRTDRLLSRDEPAAKAILEQAKLLIEQANALLKTANSHREYSASIKFTCDCVRHGYGTCLRTK